MKASFAIFVLLFIAFHVGAEDLKCYKDEDSLRKVVLCEEGKQCWLGKNERDKPPRARGCADKDVEERCKDDPRCTTCDTDLCNALQCYSSEEEKQVGCTAHDELCITDHKTDEIKCGRCEESDGDECRECNEDMCNKPEEEPLKCYNDLGPRPAKLKETCKRGEKKCWLKKDDPNGPPQAHGCASRENEAECQKNPTKCTLCDTDLCNALKCYSSTEKKQVVCTDRDDMCITDRKTDERKCGKCKDHRGLDECRACSDDMCNKPLYCLDSAEQVVQCKNVTGAGPLPKCITIIDGERAVEKNCGICSNIAPGICEECNTDKCNVKSVQILRCYNATGQLNPCGNPYHKCITTKDRDRIVDKGCGTCPKQQEHKRDENFDQLTESEDETSCKACNSDGCNKDSVVTPLKCQDNTNHVVECTDARDYCYTKKRKVKNWDRQENDLVEEKGCGKCNGSAVFDGESITFTESPGAKVGCTECYTDKCNSEKLEDKLDCFDVKSKDGSTKQCHAGEKCVVAYTKEGDNWALHQHCGLCPTDPPKLGFCKQCNTSKCNVYEYPKCKAGAGNGAGDFFVNKQCTEKLYLNKDANITATCIKQQVEGITYKDCGSCGAFVDYKVTKIPNIPKNANINKCHECVSKEGDTEPCNGAILAHQLPVPFWLLLVFGACIPWLMLYGANPFTNV